MRVGRNHRRGGRLDHISDVRVGEVAAQAADGGRRKDDVADFAQPDEKDFQLVLDRGLVDQHHRNVVFNGIDAFAGRALERCAVFDERDRRFTVGTGQNCKQFRVDGHGRNI